MSKRSGILLCYPLEERRLLEPKFGWTWPVIVQPKLNGERCRVIKCHNKIVLLSSECNEIVSVPHINAYLQEVSNYHTIPEFDNELYVHGWDFDEIHSVVSRKSDETRHEKSELMQLHTFDFVSSIAQIARISQLTYYSWMNEGPVKLVPYELAYSMTEIMEIYNRFIDLKYEGIIVRHIKASYVRKRSRFILKFKPKKKDYYKITGVLEAYSKKGLSLGRVGAFRCQDPEGTIFKVGAGRMTHDKAEEHWKNRNNLIDKFCEVQYQTISPRGAPLFGLHLDIVDINPEEASGGGIL